jgi:very-short-patch-repair endonuclease
MHDLAARQHGVATRKQLIECGLRPGAIDRRLRTGRLRPLQRAVYLMGPVAPPHARHMAAALSCGPGAVLSHRTAASLWRLLSYPADSDIDVTVPERDPGTRPGVRVHRVRVLGTDEVRTWQRIPITTPERTLLDIAPDLSVAELEQAVAEATRRGLATRRHLLTLISRYPTRHGAPALRQLLHGDRRPALTRSAAEQRFLSLVRSAELPSPEVNVRLHGFEVDFLWRDHGLVVEIDGYAYHSDPQAFERDRSRDAMLAARGYRVIRVTWRQLVDTPATVLAHVAQALARGSP